MVETIEREGYAGIQSLGGREVMIIGNDKFDLRVIFQTQPETLQQVQKVMKIQSYTNKHKIRETVRGMERLDVVW